MNSEGVAATSLFTRRRDLPRRLFFIFCYLSLVGFPTENPPHAWGQAYESDTRGQARGGRAAITRAEELYLAGRYDEADPIFRQYLDESEAGESARLGLARCLLEVGQYDEGIEVLERAGAMRSPEWHLLRATFDLRKGAYEEALSRARLAVEGDPNDARARWLLASTLETLGRREEAVDSYRWFEHEVVGRPELPEDAAWLTAAANGLVRYGVLAQSQAAERTRYALRHLLQPAYDRLDRTYWPARLAAAELLRERYNNDEKDGSVSDYLAALRVNPNLPDAHVGLGRVALLDWRFEEVERRCKQALAVNSHHVPAMTLMAENLITQRRYDEATRWCEQALRVNPRDLRTLSLHAAASACRSEDVAVERMEARAAKINPACAMFQRILGDALAGIRQYALAEARYEAAIRMDPTDANARTELGMMYMQWGFEDKARITLEAAWALDSFNERTKFTLELLDMLERFDRHETAHFIVKYDADRDPGLGAFLGGYLEELYEPLTRDYGAALDWKTIIEVFPSQRAFGVRITGKPWIPTVGACTGRVIALASPREGEDRFGRYNLATVLRHEFTHTVTLAATANRIPHWFTEGLAVYEEDGPRPFRWWELLRDAVRRGELFPLESIDWRFMRPRQSKDRELAYAQSEWMCEYIAARFGYDSIHAMLARFREGWVQERVFREQLGVAPETFDREFSTWALQELHGRGFDVSPVEDAEKLAEEASRKTDDAGLHGRLARALFDAGDYPNAWTTALRALELDPNEPVALEVNCKIASLAAGSAATVQERRAVEDSLLPVLSRLVAVRPNSWTGHKLLAELWLARGARERALEPLRQLQKHCPYDPFSWRALAGIYLDRGEEDLALTQLQELARLEDADPDVPAHIARLFDRKGRLHEARHWLRRSLFVDPFHPQRQLMLGELHDRLGDSRDALSAFEMALALEEPTAAVLTKAAFAARGAGDHEKARALARRAVSLDRTSPAAALLDPLPRNSKE